MSSIKTAKSINFVFLSLLLNWKAKFNRKIMPFEFPCHHVVSMRNICGIAKWPIDKTPTPSDVLFSIPLRQNQNNRAVANKNKITFPISIPDRENLQEKKAGKRPRVMWVFVPPAIKPTSVELVNNSLTLKTHKGSPSINCQTLELKIYSSWRAAGAAALGQGGRMLLPPALHWGRCSQGTSFHSEKSRIRHGEKLQR